MSTELGSAYLSVGLSTQGLTKDIKKSFGAAGSAGKTGGKAAGLGFASQFKGLIGPAMAAAGAAAVVGFVGSTVKAAGALEQSVGAISAVFGKSSDKMSKWSKNAASNVGLTQNEFNELGTVIGAQLKNGGTAMDQLAPKTNNLIGLGADMAAMFGGTTKDAVGAISAALRGERDTIEKYGVSLTQAAVDAKAAELGFSKVGGALSQEATQAATLALVMDQTSDAHGTFAKEAGTYSGQVQRLSAGWGDLQTSIGGLFLPIMTKAVGFINSSVMPALAGFTAIIGGGGLAGALGPLQPIFDAVLGVFASLGPKVFELVSAFSPLSLIFQAMQPILPLLANYYTQLAATIGGVLDAVIPVVTALVSMLMPVIQQFVSSILPPMIQAMTAVAAAIVPVVAVIAGRLVPVVQALMPVVQTVFSVITNIITAAMKIVQGIISVVTGLISGNWSQVWTGIKTMFAGIWDLIKSIVKGAIDIVFSVIKSVLGLISNVWNSVWDSISGFLSGAWDGIVNAVSNGIDDVLQFFKDLPGTIVSVLSGAGSWLIQTGKDMIQGLLDGIASLAGTVGKFFLDLLPGWIVGPFKAALGINSPSKVFRDFGQNIGEGVILGAGDMESKIGRTMGALVQPPRVPSFSAGAYSAVEESAGQNIYVQNPFTGEYLLGKVADVAVGATGARIGAAQRRVDMGGKYVSHLWE